MKHIAPERLAELAAKTLKEPLRAKSEEHIRGCERCEASLARIIEGRLAMAEIKKEKAPELAWESIAARIHWSTSSEMRAQERAANAPLRWRRPAFAVAAVASIAALSLWALPKGESPAPKASPSASARVLPAVIAESPEALQSLDALVTFAQGDVRVGDQPLRFDETLAAGAELSAGQGGMVVQFGDKSAFRLASNSTLLIRRFDSERIELEVVGKVDVDLTRRLPNQEFVVVAGEHEVVVRGTAFRVDFSSEQLEVTCTRGKVVVTGERGMVPVPAGQQLKIISEALSSIGLEARPLDPAELDALDRAMAMPMLPAWSDRKLLIDTTTILEVSAASQQRVAVDGIPVAEGSFFLRAMSGRHQVALMNADGELLEEEWIESSAGQRKQLQLAAKTPEVPNPTGQRGLRVHQKLRQEQMQAALDKGKRSRRCLASLAKQGLMEGSFAVFEIGVNADGSQGYLNIRESNLSPVVVQCLRRAIDAESLPQGPAAGFKLRLSF